MEKDSENGDSDDDDRKRHRHRSMIPIPHRLRRNHISRSGSVTSNSSDEGRKPPPYQFGNLEGGDENIGPLERHMRTMIAKDESGELSSPEVVSPDHWDSKHTPFPRPHSSMDKRSSTINANGRLSVSSFGHKRSRSTEGRVASIDGGMSSMDEVASNSPTSPTVPGFVGMDIASVQDPRRSSVEQKRKRHRIPVLRSRSKERNNIEQSDFATSIGKPLSPVMSADNQDPPRSSTDSARPPQFSRQRTAESSTSNLLRTNTADSTKDSGTRRFFKGGRIGEIVRGESTKLGDRFRGSRDRVGDVGAIPGVPLATTDESDVESQQNGYQRAATDSDVSPRASLDRERPKSKYYTSNLPTFKSPSSRNNRSSTIQTPMSDISDPFGKRGSIVQRETEYGNRPVPPRINLPDDAGPPDPDVTRDRSSISFDPDINNNRLSQVPTNTTIPRPKRITGYPVTGLAGEDSKRHWSISDQAPSEQATKVTSRDIARVRALLLASGIKAREIYHTASSVRETPLPLLVRAAETSGQELEPVPRKQETLLAAQLFSKSLDGSIASFETTLQNFQSTTAKNLNTELEELSHRASEQLSKLVTETSDEADAFNVELTTKQPQEIKRVEDAINALYRRRHRQFRLLVRAGFKLLEWLVLGIMWWVWFVVVLFNTGKKVVLGIFGVLRWLLWF